MTAPVVQLSQVAVVVQGKALLDVDTLTIHAGERVAIVGANGAGKSTLLRLLSGFAAPACGQVVVDGLTLQPGMKEPQLRALRQRVGQVMQGLHLMARLTALDNVLIGCLGRVQGWRSWLRLHSADHVQQAMQALQAVGVVSRAHTRSDQLSGGERQKVAIARLLMQRPHVILADEPTAALDPAAALEVCRLLVMAARGATLLTVVHSPALIPVLADRVIGLKGGRVAFDLPAADLTDAQLNELYRTGPSSPANPWSMGAVPAKPPMPHKETAP